MKKDIYFPAVLVAATVHWLFGAVWFTFFKTQWIAGVGLTPAQVQNAQAHQSPVPYLLAFICSFGFAVVLARVILLANLHSARAGARLGLMLGVGIAMLPMFTEYFFEMKHLNFAMIAGGYPAIGGLMMGAILGAWQKKPATRLLKQKAAA